MSILSRGEEGGIRRGEHATVHLNKSVAEERTCGGYGPAGEGRQL